MDWSTLLPLLVAAGGTLIAFVIRELWRKLTAYVTGTPATWDDAIVDAINKALDGRNDTGAPTA